MTLKDHVQDLTPDLKVFLGRILESSCQEHFKNLAKSSQDLVGIYIQDLGKIFIKSCRILSILFSKYNLTKFCTRSLWYFKVFLGKILESSCQKPTKNLPKAYQNLA